MKETAKWGCFLSILGFVFLAISVSIVLFVGCIFSKIGSFGGMNPMMGIGTGFFLAIYLIIALLYFFPIYYLFQFSSNIKNAFKYNYNEQLNGSFLYLKSHYKFMGILALIFVSFL
ncbi:putative membrane protein [Flavobacterium sp. 7A]|nr:putative membrane protein [Flavobacterium sp. 7A]